MLRLLLWAQLTVASNAVDSTYSSTALREMIAAAVESNRRPPVQLRSYRNRIETELALIVRDTLGREHTAEVEQLAAAATWSRTGRYDLHIIGYRAQNIGVPYSTLSLVRAWTVPSLYGERLSLGAYFTRTRAGDTLTAVHPFAADREGFYRFSGGDTIAVLRASTRRIPITRIRVRPNFHGPTRLAAFDGEIELDAERGQIVRMRGQFVVVGGARTKRQLLSKATGVVSVAYIEFVNAEFNGAYWLPSFQRTEFQASFPLLGQTRPVFRLVSTMSDVTVNDTGAVVTSDSVEVPRLSVSWAPRDSIASYDAWRREIGTQSSSVHADDFRDLAPDVWRIDGPPRVRLLPNATSRILRFNRVEGLFTGLAPSIDFRDAVPGLSTGIHAGVAWAEHTVRGGAFASYTRRHWISGARAERSLASTNDFALPLDDDPGIAALLGSIDNHDYVDQRRATVSLTRVLSAVDVGLASLQIGIGSDRGERARLSHGLFSGSTTFRENRGVAAGNYAIAMAELEFHPNVTGDFAKPGIGARLRYAAASGGIDWQRVELAVSARRYWGPWSVAAHADGGVVLANHPPPQTLFELGGNEELPGYAYKQFAGDRAALFRSFASYQFPLWRRPIHFWRNYFFPGLGPGIAASVQGGWTELSSIGAREAASALGAGWSPVAISEATAGVRATVGAGFTLFSNAVHVGLARPLDRPAPWRLTGGVGATF